MSDKNSKPLKITPIGEGGNKDTPMEQRLLLTFGLMMLVMLGTSYFMPKSPEAPKKPAAKEAVSAPAAAKPDTAKPDGTKPAAAAKAAPSKPAAKVAASAEETVTVDTSLYRVEMTNRGGRVKTWQLKKYSDADKRRVELVNLKAAPVVGNPFAYRFHTPQSADHLNQALHRMTVSPDGLTVAFEYNDGQWLAKKNLAFKKDSYVVRVSSEVQVGGTGKPHLLEWRGGFGDATVIGAAAAQFNVYLEQQGSEVMWKPAKDAETAPQSNRGRFQFAGINDTYFAMVALPDQTRDFELHTLADKAPNMVDGKEEPFVGTAFGGDGSNQFDLFVGPKDSGLLKSISPRLGKVVDFGYFEFAAKPLFDILNWVNSRYIHNYGWTIVAITVIINMLMMPLKMTSMNSMKKMSALKPEIDAINEKYKGMSMSDPRKKNQTTEVMALYSKHGVNPLNLGGCLPLLIQFPFFFAFYKVLSVAIEMRGAPWLWVTDLSRPESFALRPLPLAMTVTQYFMQKMTPTPTADPSQRMVMLAMPFFMLFVFWHFSSGLVLYWLTGNIVGIAQQWFFNRLASGSAPATPPPAKKARK